MTDTITTPAMPRINEPAPDFSAKTTHGDRTLAERWPTTKASG